MIFFSPQLIFWHCMITMYYVNEGFLSITYYTILVGN